MSCCQLHSIPSALASWWSALQLVVGATLERRALCAAQGALGKRLGALADVAEYVQEQRSGLT